MSHRNTVSADENLEAVAETSVGGANDGCYKQKVNLISTKPILDMSLPKMFYQEGLEVTSCVVPCCFSVYGFSQ